MRLRANRQARVGAVALVAIVAAVAVAQGATTGFVPFRDSTCWSCHANWSPPPPTLPSGEQAMAVAVLPEAAGAAAGERFTYDVTLQNIWRSDITFLAPALDLRDAPSLRFAGGHAPDHNVTLVSISPGTNVTSPQVATTSFYVPGGVTSLAFAAIPRTTDPNVAPDITLLVRNPSGTLLEPVDASGPGQPENRTITEAELAVGGAGVWRVSVSYVPLGPPGPGGVRPPILGRQDIDIVEDAVFDTASKRVLAYPRTEFVGKLTSSLQTWDLDVIQEPKPGEKVRVWLNATLYYKHINPQTQGGDYANLTVATEADVILQDGKLVVSHPKVGTVGPAIVNGPTASTISEAVGYASTFLLVSSIWSGGMFGRASRRQLNHVFGSAKRRVAFHNFLSYGLTVAAIVHTAIFLFRISEDYQVTLGLIWGSAALLSMLGLGLTGALQVPMIRKWSYGSWRWWHYGLTVAAIVFTLVHLMLDGRNFGDFQDFFGWRDPFHTVPGA